MLFLMLSSCSKDFLQRFPLSQLSPETFFTSAQDLQFYTNGFYSLVPGQVSDGGSSIWYTYTDDVARTGPSNEVKGTRTVPVSGGGWTWTTLRDIDFYLGNSYKCTDVDSRLRYDGVAKFFRAWFYFMMVKRFGDVPWYSNVMESNDSLDLNKPRDSRMLVVDSILDDLDFAIANLPTSQSIDQVTKWTALALKSRVCLYEGTWRKYHANDAFGKDSYGKPLTGWQDLLEQCVAASTALMQGGVYSIYTGGGQNSYQQLFNATAPAIKSAIAKEVILARVFDGSIQYYHGANFHTLSASYGRPGVTKSLINSYLMKDGSRFTDIPGYETMQFYDECQNRDPRLAQTIITPGYKRIGSNQVSVPSFGSSITGYEFSKFVTDSTEDNSHNTNDLPVFRYAETLLNFAEAKAELGELTQGDLDQSVGVIRSRVAMPDISLAQANADPDPVLAAQYPNVSGSDKGVILEIRRERGVELIREDFRWDDLMRWGAGHLLAIPFKGMYLPGLGSYDLDHNGTVDLVLYQGQKPPQAGPQYYTLSEIVLDHSSYGNVIANPGLIKQFNEARDYLYPIPTQELLLNPKLVQNPGW
jgi:hypothetical protein